MEFKHETLDILKWEVDEETLHLAQQLTELGTSLNAKEAPSVQPILEGIKKLGMLWIVLKWEYILYDIEDKVVLEYVAEDKYKIDSRPATNQNTKDLLKQSFSHLIQGFDLKNKLSKFEGIQPLEPHEFDRTCQNIKLFFEERNL